MSTVLWSGSAGYSVSGSVPVTVTGLLTVPPLTSPTGTRLILLVDVVSNTRFGEAEAALVFARGVNLPQSTVDFRLGCSYQGVALGVVVPGSPVNPVPNGNSTVSNAIRDPNAATEHYFSKLGTNVALGGSLDLTVNLNEYGLGTSDSGLMTALVFDSGFGPNDSLDDVVFNTSSVFLTGNAVPKTSDQWYSQTGASPYATVFFFSMTGNGSPSPVLTLSVPAPLTPHDPIPVVTQSGSNFANGVFTAWVSYADPYPDTGASWPALVIGYQWTGATGYYSLHDYALFPGLPPPVAPVVPTGRAFGVVID